MPRAKGGVVSRRRHNKVLKQASGYYGRKSTTFRAANQQVMKSLMYAYRDRRAASGISVACGSSASTRRHARRVAYSRFIDGLRKAGVEVDRKMLADLAVHDGEAFGQLVEKARASLGA